MASNAIISIPDITNGVYEVSIHMKADNTQIEFTSAPFTSGEATVALASTGVGVEFVGYCDDSLASSKNGAVFQGTTTP